MHISKCDFVYVCVLVPKMNKYISKQRKIENELIKASKKELKPKVKNKYDMI